MKKIDPYLDEIKVLSDSISAEKDAVNARYVQPGGMLTTKNERLHEIECSNRRLQLHLNCKSTLHSIYYTDKGNVAQSGNVRRSK